MLEWIGELFDDAKVWLRRRVCRHAAPPEYNEIRTAYFDGMVRWSAFYECPRCGMTMSVEASYFGKREQLLKAFEGEEGA